MKKEKVDWPASVVWFFKGFGNIFLDGIGHWMRRIKRVIRINQLSEQKYIHMQLLTRA